MRSLSIPVRANGRIVAVAQSVHPLAQLDSQLADLDRSLAMLIPLAILVAAFSGAFIIGATMRPLRHLTASARRLKADMTGERLPIIGDDEFARLSWAFNEAFERSAAAFASQRQAIAQLERFTGDAGHELRTPLGAVKSGASYLLHMTDLPAEARKSLQIIDRSTDRMARLIDDLLLLAKSDGGRPLRLVPGLNVRRLVEESVEELSIPPTIRVLIEGEIACAVTGDPESIKRVVANLVSNAITYARSKVEVRTYVENAYAVISVADDGMGIESVHLARLGERFYRPDDSRSRHLGGTGLGLAIAKSLCTSHGGDLEITSEIGVGTTVRSRIPIGKITV
jgi:signal transduction histidine kinase